MTGTRGKEIACSSHVLLICLAAGEGATLTGLHRARANQENGLLNNRAQATVVTGLAFFLSVYLLNLLRL